MVFGLPEKHGWMDVGPGSGKMGGRDGKILYALSLVFFKVWNSRGYAHKKEDNPRVESYVLIGALKL